MTEFFTPLFCCNQTPFLFPLNLLNPLPHHTVCSQIMRGALRYVMCVRWCYLWELTLESRKNYITFPKFSSSLITILNLVAETLQIYTVWRKCPFGPDNTRVLPHKQSWKILMPDDHVLYTDHIVKQLPPAEVYTTQTPTRPLQIAKTFENYNKSRDYIYGIWQHKVLSLTKGYFRVKSYERKNYR